MPDWLLQLIEGGQASEGSQINPYQQSYQYALGDFNPFNIYSYEGLNPDIMSALQNVFNYSDVNDFAPTFSIFGDEAPEISGFGGGDYIFGQDGVLPVTDIFDPASLANTLSQIAGIDPDTGDPIRPGEVKALTPEMIEKTTSEYYTPYEEAQRAELVEDLASARTGVSTGGFAGSAARQAGLSGAERLYRGGYEDILAGILKARGAASTDVLDTIYGWQELMDV